MHENEFAILISGASVDGDTSARRSFSAAVCDDEVTSADEWNEIARLCRERGYDDCAAELLANVAAASAARNAAIRAQNEQRPEVNDVVEPERQEPSTAGEAAASVE
jgi:hypothetical protein